MLVAKFDELNVISEVDSLYKGLYSDNWKKFKELFAARYIEMLLYLMVKASKFPTDDEIDELAEIHMAKLLSEPNEVTHYTYDTEVYRKRDRAKEAINSVNGKVLKQIEMDKHIRYWSAMTGWYLDFTSQDAEIQAFKDAGIERVQRHEMKDDKVCAVCKKADGAIYDIDHIPPLDHLRCRRWFTEA